MGREKILNNLQEIIKDVLDNENIILQEKTCMEDIEEWDSVVQMTVMAVLERKLDMRFDIGKLANARTIADIIDMVMK